MPSPIAAAIAPIVQALSIEHAPNDRFDSLFYCVCWDMYLDPASESTVAIPRPVSCARYRSLAEPSRLREDTPGCRRVFADGVIAVVSCVVPCP